MLLNRHLEHLTCGCTVDIAAVLKDLCPPVLSGKPGDNSCLDSRKVCYIELLPISRDKGGTNQLRERVRNIFVKHVQGIEITVSYKRPCIGEILHVILRQILQLHEPSGKAAGTVGTVELEHPSAPVIPAGGILHGLILFHR